MAQALGTIFTNDHASVTVGDFGCGFGQYGKYFKHDFPSLQWTGYDGSENIETATKGHVKFLDLSEPQVLQDFDWAMAIEVAEHLPPSMEASFIYFLTRHNQKGAVLTWALPKQGGHHHVNGQTNEYVKCVFTKVLGYTVDDEAERQIRKDIKKCFWLKNTFMFFRKPAEFKPLAWESQARKMTEKYVNSSELLPSYLKAVLEAGCKRSQH